MTDHHDSEEYVLGLQHGRAEAGGAMKKNAHHQRKFQMVSNEIANVIAKNAGLRHEIKRLEDVLVWIHRTKQPIGPIRTVIEETIPRKFQKEEDAHGV